MLYPFTLSTLCIAPPSLPGYLPKDLYNLHSSYGYHHDLQALIDALKGTKTSNLHHLDKGVAPMADVVVNHRIGTKQAPDGSWTRFEGGMDWEEWAVTSDTGGQVRE